MNGLKVYLKSGITKVYLYSQALVGVVILANVLREYELFDHIAVPILLNVFICVALVVNAVMPRKFQRKLRYLPGILIFVGGLALAYLVKTATGVRYFHFHQLFVYLGYLFSIWGLSQFLFDVRRVIYFTTEGLRLRMSIMGTRNYGWDEVKAVVFQDRGFVLECTDGKTYKLSPYEGDSQNMRVRIDKLMGAAKHGSLEASGEHEGTAQERY